MKQIRAMHYLNQFFAARGGEEKADLPVGFSAGAVGPGRRLQELLGDSVKIVVTVYCGDNYFAEHTEESLTAVLPLAQSHDIDLVIAGPAFQAGRYGFACAEVCHFLSAALGLYAIAAMNIENPGIEAYRQHKDRKVFILPAAEAVAGMGDALSRMAKLASRIAAGSDIGAAADEGYIPRGFRFEQVAGKTGAERAVDILLDKLAGRPFHTEIPLATFERIPVTPGIANLSDSCLALATTGGLVPAGNPDGFKMSKNARWMKYPIDKLTSMKDVKWDICHTGYDTSFMYADPNYGVPLDASRELERAGAFARLYPYLYSTCGSNGLLTDMQTIGREMALDMKSEGLDMVLLVST